MKPTRIFDLPGHCVSRFPGHPVFAEKVRGKWTFLTSEQYAEQSRHFALGLLELGFQPGDRILTVSNNRPQWNIAEVGMTLAGLVHVPAYTSMNRDEYAYVLEHSGARGVIVSDRKLCDLIRPLAEEATHVDTFHSFDAIDGVPHWTEVLERGAGASPSTRETLDRISGGIRPDDLACIIYTSGTMGRSKGVMLSHRNLVENFLAGHEVFQLGPEDRYLSIIPVCHVGGRLGNYQTQYAGACIYYAENMGTIAANLKEIKATGFDAVPRILEKIFDNVLAKGRALKGMKRRLFFWAVNLGFRYVPPGEQSWLYARKLKVADRLIYSKWREALGGEARLVGCGGASLQDRLQRVFWACGLKVINIYGLTETSPTITINRQEPGLTRLGTVGSVIDGVELKIAPDGEILCRGHNVMLGYYNDETLTREVIDEEGWFHTGDVGVLEDGKFLRITDRKKEIFKLSNGKFVAPQTIENQIKTSVFVDQVMVVGEHEKFASALLVPDFNYLKEWCIAREIPQGNDRTRLLEDARVVDAFQQEIRRINKNLQEWERINRIRLVSDEWSPMTGELSASLKLKRKVLMDKYPHLLESIYSKERLA
ncbi:MAG: long-chain fatty acid--CoA ligase [Bacteroidales bacterium]